jgi:hypothetical protein
MRAFAASLLLLAGLAACGGDNPPDVDWSQVPAYQRAGIDDAVTSGDCDRMQTAFDGSKRADVLAYLDWHMRDAGCY